MNDETDGWKGRPPSDRCLEANVTSPKLHISSKAPPQHTTQGGGPDGHTPRILYTKTSGYPWPLDTVKSPKSEWGGAKKDKIIKYIWLVLSV
jgi:hypothetical protein